MPIYEVKMRLYGSYLLKAEDEEDAKQKASNKFENGEDPDTLEFTDVISVWQLKEPKL